MTAEAERQKRSKFGLGALMPVAIFALLAVIFVVALNSGDPSKLPSALIGKPAPETFLKPLEGLNDAGQPIPGIDVSLLAGGGVKLVNVWASWCGPCRVEHPFLMELEKRPDIKMVGINYKDKPSNARQFLGSHGNPYGFVGVDNTGRAAVDWGVYGVPETFVVDGKGVIRYKHVGPLSAEAVEQKIIPAIKSAAGS